VTAVRSSLVRVAGVVALGAASTAGAVVRQGDHARLIVVLGTLGTLAVVAGLSMRRTLVTTPGLLALGGAVLAGERGHDWSAPWLALCGTALAALTVVLAPSGAGHPETVWDEESRAGRRRVTAGALVAGGVGGLVVGAAATADAQGGALFAVGCAAALGSVALSGLLLREATRPARPARPATGGRRPQEARAGTGSGAGGPT